MKEPDMVLHNGLTRIFGPELTDEEFEVLDEDLALGIIKFWKAIFAEQQKQQKDK